MGISRFLNFRPSLSHKLRAESKYLREQLLRNYATGMNWTQSRPIEEGVYWFRRAKSKPQQQVRIKEGKVFFPSGHIKDLIDMRGQWRGPIVSTGQADQPRLGFFRTVFGLLPNSPGKKAIVFASPILVSVFVTVLLGKLALTESRLEYVGIRPLTPEIVEHKAEGNRRVFHVRHSVPFKNYGLVSDHVSRIEIANDGLTPGPQEVKILHVDQTEITWLKTKEIKYEALIYIDPSSDLKPGEKEKSLFFRTYFYGSKGNEIYGGGLLMEIAQGPDGFKQHPRNIRKDGSSG